MINFFRKTRKKLADDNKFLKYSRYAIGEIALVVIGILIALQINNINEKGKDNRIALTYINNLKLDLVSDINEIEKSKKNVDFYEKEGYYSLNVIEGKVNEVDKTRFLKSLMWNSHYHPFQISRSTYEDLISTGNIRLLKNNDLKVALTSYYLQNRWVQQFEQRAKDTYWYTYREEMLKSVDPFMMKTFYESEFFPEDNVTIKFEDINVDFVAIRNHKSLRDEIARVLSLRVWQRNHLQIANREIDRILDMLNDAI
jgi:hypothetical protein